MGGVNLTFLHASPGDTVSIILGEVLTQGGGGVLFPMTTGNKWNSTWTLSGQTLLDTNIVNHEFVQFRYAQVDQHAPPQRWTAFSPSTALAWVIQHPVGGNGVNPWEHPCSTSTPAAVLWGSAGSDVVLGGGGPTTPLATFTSSLPALDTVWNFSAYTIAATTLDTNVDGQTRERDIDIVDSLITARGQYAVFSPGDASAAERTLREAFTNDTGLWSQWYDFKASAVMYARDHALFTGDLRPSSDFYNPSPRSITVPPTAAYNSLQFYSGLGWYFNASGAGLYSFPPDGTCGGSWACEVLLDWPVATRDGYDATSKNYEDTARNALAAMALSALSDVGAWLGKKEEETDAYRAASQSILSSLLTFNLRTNTSSGLSWFVDGRVGAASSHAAVHSTLFAVSAGAAEGVSSEVAAGLVAFLVHHGVPPSSCMMGRWWVEALYALGRFHPAGADAALAVLTSATYPGWIDMLNQGATCTMEAWRPQDKGNLDWAHPWCASPAFTIPGFLLGALPTSPAWSSWRLAPQPSNVSSINAAIPTPAGMVPITWEAAETGGGGRRNATVTLGVLAGQTATVCLPIPGSAESFPASWWGGGGRTPLGGTDELYVDGVPVASPVVEGRFLCSSPLPLGSHAVSRITTL